MEPTSGRTGPEPVGAAPPSARASPTLGQSQSDMQNVASFLLTSVTSSRIDTRLQIQSGAVRHLRTWPRAVSGYTQIPHGEILEEQSCLSWKPGKISEFNY